MLVNPGACLGRSANTCRLPVTDRKPAAPRFTHCSECPGRLFANHLCQRNSCLGLLQLPGNLLHRRTLVFHRLNPLPSIGRSWPKTNIPLDTKTSIPLRRLPLLDGYPHKPYPVREPQILATMCWLNRPFTQPRPRTPGSSLCISHSSCHTGCIPWPSNLHLLLLPRGLIPS